MPQLVSTDKSSLLIGRGQTNHLQLVADARVSRTHAAISRDSQGLLVRDLGSANGTWVNDIRVAGEARLAVGDRVRVGDTELLVQANHLVVPDQVLIPASPALASAAGASAIPMAAVALSLGVLAVVLLAISPMGHNRPLNVAMLPAHDEPSRILSAGYPYPGPGYPQPPPPSPPPPTLVGIIHPPRAPTPDVPPPISYPPPYPRPSTATPAPLQRAYVKFQARPGRVCPGQCATLVWDVNNVRALYLDHEDVAVSGSRSVCPLRTTRYNLSWLTLDGSEDHKAISIAVNACDAPTPNPTPTPTDTPTPGEVSPIYPPPTYPPPPAPAPVTPTPFACPNLDAPPDAIREALAQPDRVEGWMQLCNPNVPYDPVFNTRRVDLNKLNPNIPYDQQFNGLVYKCGCR